MVPFGRTEYQSKEGPALFALSTRRSIPGELETFLIAPIVKIGKDPGLAQNYRPRALVNCTAKILENLMKQRMECSIGSSCMLPEEVNGFRRGE